jgi:hypothetical protein
LAKN